MMAAVVLGDYLYIDGGELAQLVEGELEIYPRTLGKTRSITAANVGLTLFSKKIIPFQSIYVTPGQTTAWPSMSLPRTRLC